MAQVNSDPTIARHIDKMWPTVDELLKAGESVEQLALQFGWTLVMDIIDREIATIDRSLDGGAEPLSQAQYAMAHGRRGGLRTLKSTVDTIVVKYTTELEKQRAKHEAGGESSAGG